MITEKEIIKRYLGIPYKHRGRTLDGLDCWGLIKSIYKDFGYDLWDIEEDYDENWAWEGRDHFIENYHKQWDKVEKPELFDVVLFKNSKDIANHGGVVLSNDKFIHCCKAGTVINRLSDSHWQKRLQGFYRLKR